ncbi:hypothetical protein [Chamaesiphon sp.]|uniref:hypothetical protein n=1 Tax=Chamaesiphon sp. TaxID=2814140 RepID=UPI00359416C1
MHKAEILNYLRDRAAESHGAIIRIHGEKDFKERGAAINKAISLTTTNLKTIIFQRALSQGWGKDEILKNVLIVTYCSYVVMIEFRNMVWPYEYMAFSRRVGELWEPFCKLCFDYPVRTDVELYEPPLFSQVREQLQDEILQYIHNLNLSSIETTQLISYYDKVWSLVTSGEIKLELDLHFRISETNFNVDFKSGFQSNEKGNTNRLLLVASIYKNIIGSNNECILFVRANEDDNNHYLQILKKSGIWGVYCGTDTYFKIKEYSGFDLANWIENNISWNTDLSQETNDHFHQNDLNKYLVW